MENFNKKSFIVNIPLERVGVLIGTSGNVKSRIEKELNVSLSIDSKEGVVTITLLSKNDPSKLFRAKDIVLAIGRGFSPERAFKLFDENTFLRIIDLESILGRNKNTLRRIKGRIIGAGGKTRRIIEEYTKTFISVYGHTVSIIGDMEGLQIAEEAINRLINGAQHSSVYRFLNEYAHKRKFKKILSY
ncbi:MAG: KH domain-containing protein [Nitrososphaerota archaeon]